MNPECPCTQTTGTDLLKAIPANSEPDDLTDNIDFLKSEVYHLQAVIRKVRSLHIPRCEHECPDWDGLLIDEFDPEFSSCTCDWKHKIPRRCKL